MGRRHNRPFSKEDLQMDNRHMKKYAIPLAIREIQIKTTLRYNFTPIRMAKIDKAGNNKCWQGCGERGTVLHCWWECKLVQPLWKPVWRFLKKLKIELPYDPAIALLVIYPKDTDVVKRRGTCTPMCIAPMFTIAKLWKEPRCPSTDEWIRRCGPYILWNITQPSERTITQHLQQHGTGGDNTK